MTASPSPEAALRGGRRYVAARLGGLRGAARHARAAYWQAYLDGVAREPRRSSCFATPQELANFFVFLCSDRASYSVGSTVERRHAEARLSAVVLRRRSRRRTSMATLRHLFAIRPCQLIVRQTNEVGDAGHAGNVSDIGLGAAPLIGQVHSSGNRHPTVLNVDI